jgi:Zn-dependent protease
MKKWARLRRVRIVGAPVYVHWSVLLVVALLAFMSFKSPIHAAVSILSYFGVIAVHELGHAIVAHRLGYEVDAVHISVLHGFCLIDAPHTESDAVQIAWGGVLAQLAIAIPVLTVAQVFPEYDFGYVAPVIAFLGYVNLFIALINLVPAPGLDGATAWRVIPLLGEWWRARRTAKRTVARFTRRR